jgi:hypothetical protein
MTSYLQVAVPPGVRWFRVKLPTSDIVRSA